MSDNIKIRIVRIERYASKGSNTVVKHYAESPKTKKWIELDLSGDFLITGYFSYKDIIKLIPDEKIIVNYRQWAAYLLEDCFPISIIEDMYNNRKSSNNFKFEEYLKKVISELK